jgi:transcriptional regulator with XRE-family HTH domain
MEMRETLVRNLRRYRRVQRLSQEELGHRAELDRTYISSLERCVYSATVDAVERLAAALGIPALELLTPSSESAEVKSSSAASAEGAGKTQLIHLVGVPEVTSACPARRGRKSRMARQLTAGGVVLSSESAMIHAPSHGLWPGRAGCSQHLVRPLLVKLQPGESNRTS